MLHTLHDHAPSHRVNCKFKSTLCISNVYPLEQITTSCNYDAEQTQLSESLCGRLTCSLGQTAISPCLIFRQFSLLPSCVASTKVLLCCSFNALNTKSVITFVQEERRKKEARILKNPKLFQGLGSTSCRRKDTFNCK